MAVESSYPGLINFTQYSLTGPENTDYMATNKNPMSFQPNHYVALAIKYHKPHILAPLLGLPISILERFIAPVSKAKFGTETSGNARDQY